MTGYAARPTIIPFMVGGFLGLLPHQSPVPIAPCDHQRVFLLTADWPCGMIELLITSEGEHVMAQVRVRNLDDAVVQEFKERAKRLGSNVEALLRTLLTNEAKRPRQEWYERVGALHDTVKTQCGELPDSTEYIRDQRERRT